MKNILLPGNACNNSSSNERQNFYMPPVMEFAREKIETYGRGQAKRKGGQGK